MILYFSGTGNTKFVAEYLAEALDDELIAMADTIRSGDTLRGSSGKPFVFLAPIYAWRFPRAVEELIRDAELGGAKAVYCIATRESQSGAAAEYMRKIIEGKGLDFKGFTSVDMPNQYLLSSPVSTPEQTRERLKQVLPQLKTLAEKIQRGDPLTDNGSVALPRLMSGIVNTASYKFMITSKNFIASDACVGCGSCAKRCPMGNVEMKDGKPIFGGKCTWCFSCIQYCPKAAIDIKNRTEGQPRYTCPEYKAYKKSAEGRG